MHRNHLPSQGLATQIRRAAAEFPALHVGALAWLTALFSVYDSQEPDAPKFRARQLQALLRLTPVAMSINLGNGLIVTLVLWAKADRAFLLAWSFAIIVLALAGLHGWLKAMSQPERSSASGRALRRAAVQAGVLGMVWGILPAAVFARLDSSAQFFVGMVTTGMICAGGFALSSVPGAATAYVVALSLGGLWAIGSSALDHAHGLSLMLLAYSCIVISSAWVYAKTFGARLVAEACAERQHEVIGLLLRDFEDHSSDLLWELDARGRFVHVSPRLAQALGVPAAKLAGRRAWALPRRWMPSDEPGIQQWATLRSHLDAQRTFRDLRVSLSTPAGPRWWALSGRPLVDERGRSSGWRGVATDITEKQLADRRLSWLANNDSLTGLVNRHQFRELLRALLQAPASAPHLAVVCFDLDGFKQINDGRGHAAGDQLLAMFGQRLLANGRRSDTVARLGGDEFAMVLRGVRDEQEVRTLLDRLLPALSQPCDVQGRLESLRTSIGVALAPSDGTDVDTLLNHADLALYSAKHAGGNRYCFFHASLAEGNRRRAALAQALRGAVGRGEFRLEYQAQVATADRQICGFEALLRWRHPEHGEVLPAEFVPIAEHSGLMHEIGDWVLRTACDEAALWPRPVSVSINVSATQLNAEGFAERVVAAAARIRSERVELEVTESALIDDADAAVAALKSLRAQGFRTALDDFGTGYSALGYLRRFPFDTLKIDRSFIRDLTRDVEAQVLVDTILAMARALRMNTVAEGVETAAEAQMLRQRGCVALQGYLISRPLPSGAVAQFLSQWPGEAEAESIEWAQVA